MIVLYTKKEMMEALATTAKRGNGRSSGNNGKNLQKVVPRAAADFVQQLKIVSWPFEDIKKVKIFCFMQKGVAKS